jgi:hypothetical protein
VAEYGPLPYQRTAPNEDGHRTRGTDVAQHGGDRTDETQLALPLGKSLDPAVSSQEKANLPVMGMPTED